MTKGVPISLSIRWKLLGTYLLVLAVMGGTLYAYLSRTLERQLIGEIRAHLLSEAELAALMAGNEIRDIHRDAPRAASAIGARIRARVTIITPAGEVTGDSEVPPAELPRLENHLHRPEVQEALRTGIGSSIRHSATLDTDMLYVAIPVTATPAANGIMRLALPLATVERTEQGLRTTLLAALLVSVVVALVLSSILSQVTSRTLRTMTGIAGRIGTGDFSQRLPVPTRDELGELARVINEMTDRIEGQLARMDAERTRLDTILRGMGEGVMVADGRGTVTLVNPAFQRLFAVGDTVVGRPLIEISRHPDLHEAFNVVTSTRSDHLREVFLPQGGEKTVLTHWVPLLADGTLQGVVAVFHDISDLKRLERVRKDFVANVSHELRTPVTVIKGYAETLLTDVLDTDPAAARRFVTVIQNHAERLATLIGDLLTLSELESSTFAISLAPLSLDESVRRVIGLLEARADAKEIALDCPPLTDLPRVLADRGRLEQVLVNLLDNAIKYTPPGGRVTVTATAADRKVLVAVADTGQGIPPQDLPRIFERFYRVDAARSRAEGGTGLGLSIVKHIVQLHGGTVTVESTHGKGSTFRFDLQTA